MFRDMIQARRDAWFNSEECTVGECVSYIELQGRMRDAQVDAIKTYLFLKIACGNRTLSDLFKTGFFNTLDLDEQELRTPVRDYLKEHPAAAAFYELCTIMAPKDKGFKRVLEDVKKDPGSLDYDAFFDAAFYGVSYSDYVFSLPMGAGKTFLMAAFIYLDLYFSSIDPGNPAFARNFIILVPSGLKTSIMPSLRTIQGFDPTWVMDRVAADRIRKGMKFDVLDEGSSAKKSNRVRNPNARKVALHLYDPSLRGLVLVTNAEKVILDRIRDAAQTSIDDTDEDRIANELRSVIGRIPRLTIMIDEVHHATDDSIKLRAVVNAWAESGNVVGVLGFSGTPYLRKPEKIPLGNGMSISNDEIGNVVQFYPLVKGVGNFLKVPTIRVYEDRDRHLEIVSDGTRDFLDRFRDVRYPGGLVPKLAIYCTSIEALETEVYPLVSAIAEEYGLNPSEAILKFHIGNKDFKPPQSAAMEFATLDSPISRIRIVLLVQIGKEGWDCRSLTGVILSTQTKSTKNMVLQTCCRCLRQVSRHQREEARIYLNGSNEKTLSDQLKNEQRATITDFQTGTSSQVNLVRYDRTPVIGNPSIACYQLRVETTFFEEEDVDVAANLRSISPESLEAVRVVVSKSLGDSTLSKEIEDNEYGAYLVDVASYNLWMDEIRKGGFGFITRGMLEEQESELRRIYDAITYDSGGVTYFSSKFDRAELNSMIRRAFYAKRTAQTRSEDVPETADLLAVERFTREITVSKPEQYMPAQEKVLEAMERDPMGFDGREQMQRVYHYMPYNLGSGFERKVLQLLCTIARPTELEVYYSGDRFLTDFHIRCYRRVGNSWSKVGRYTPDMLVMDRDKEGEIHRILIVETKGAIYAGDETFRSKREFVEDHFIRVNNDKAGYGRFRYLYIEDSLGEAEQVRLVTDAVKEFFEVRSCR